VAAVEFLVVLIAFVGRRKIENIECAGQVFQRVQPKLAVFSHYTNIVRADVLHAVTQSYAGRVEFGEDLMTIEIGSAINIRPFGPASK